jgi:SAM-dependent methyltransferase
MAQCDSPADVPSPIDFHLPSDAEQWAATAMVKRPWRQSFFRSFVSELQPLVGTGGSILELGSGPGFLARQILESLPQVTYTALDFSASMHALARERLGSLAQRVGFVQLDFKTPDWAAGLSSYDAVVTMQAVHELRHKRHAASLYKAVRRLLRPGGLFLVCDPVCGEGVAANESLYMSLEEHRHALREAGFYTCKVRHEGGMVMYRAQVERRRRRRRTMQRTSHGRDGSSR